MCERQHVRVDQQASAAASLHPGAAATHGAGAELREIAAHLGVTVRAAYQHVRASAARNVSTQPSAWLSRRRVYIEAYSGV